MAERKPDPANLSRWGVSDLPLPPEDTGGVRSVDTNTFASKWLTDNGEQPKFDTNNWTSTINAGTGGIIEGIPIVGPYIASGAEKSAAFARSKIYGTPYEEELKAVQQYRKQSTDAHRVASVAGELTGGIAPFIALGGIPAVSNALGMTGTLGARTGLGLTSNALIGGADSAVRSGGDLTQTGTGAALGGAIGGAAPLVGRAVGSGANWLMRPGHDPVTERLLAVAAEHGVPIGAAQTSTSPFVRKVSQIAGQFPGSGQNMFQGEQVRQFTRAVARSFGEDADSLTPQVMQSARRRLGREFDHVAENTTIRADEPFHRDMTTIAHEARSVLPESELRPLANQMNNIAQLIDDGGNLSGQAYQNLTKKGAPLDRAIHSQDPNVAHYAGRIREAIDDAMQRSATPENAQRLRDARYQYKNMMTVAPLVVRGVPGEVTPLSLQSKVNQSFSNRAFSGGGDLGDLADLGQRFFRNPADSGTPAGTLIVDQIMRHGNALAAASLAAMTGGGYLAGYDPADILKGVGGLTAAGALARGTTSVFNRPHTMNRLISRAPYVAPYATGVSSNQLAQPTQ